MKVILFRFVVGTLILTFFIGCRSKRMPNRDSIPNKFQYEIQSSINSFLPHVINDTGVVLITFLKNDFVRMEFESGCYSRLKFGIKEADVRDLWVLDEEEVLFVVVQNEEMRISVNEDVSKGYRLMEKFVNRQPSCDFKIKSAVGSSEFSFTQGKVIRHFFTVVDM